MKITTLKQLGAFIRDQRRQRDWTQQELADASGTLQSWLSGVEKGRGNPEFAKLMAVLRALEVTLDLQEATGGERSDNRSATPGSGRDIAEEAATGRVAQPGVSVLRSRFRKRSKQ